MSVLQESKGTRYTNLSGGASATDSATSAQATTRSNDVMLLLGPLMAGGSNSSSKNSNSNILSSQLTSYPQYDVDHVGNHDCQRPSDLRHYGVIVQHEPDRISYGTSPPHHLNHTSSTTCNVPVATMTTAPVSSSVSLDVGSVISLPDPLTTSLQKEILTSHHLKSGILTQSLVTSNAVVEDGRTEPPVLDLSDHDSHIFTADGGSINLTDMVAFELTAGADQDSNPGFMSVVATSHRSPDTIRSHHAYSPPMDYPSTGESLATNSRHINERYSSSYSLGSSQSDRSSHRSDTPSSSTNRSPPLHRTPLHYVQSAASSDSTPSPAPSYILPKNPSTESCSSTSHTPSVLACTPSPCRPETASPTHQIDTSPDSPGTTNSLSLK